MEVVRVYYQPALGIRVLGWLGFLRPDEKEINQKIGELFKKGYRLDSRSEVTKDKWESSKYTVLYFRKLR